MAGKNVEDVKMRLRLEKGRQFKRGVDDAAKSVKGLGKSSNTAAARMKKLGLASSRFAQIGEKVRRSAALASTALVGLGALGVKSAIEAASDLNEEVNKTQMIFGKSTKVINKFAADAANALGMSKKEAYSFAGQIGGLFKNAGNSESKAASLSKAMVGLSSDLASFFNTDPSDAFDALRSGLTGEVEPMRRYNVFLSDAAVQQEGISRGLQKTSGHLTDQQKIMLRYSLIMRQTKDAQGDFQRTSKGLANQQRILRANITNLEATLGKALLPTVNKGVQGLNKFIRGMQRGTGAGGKFVKMAKASGLAVNHYVIQPLAKAGKWIAKSKDRTTALAIGLGVAAAAMTAFGIATAIAASPVYLVVAAIGLLAAGFYYAWQRSETFRTAMRVAWTVLKNVPAIFVIRHLKDIIGFVSKLPGRVTRATSGIWDGLKSGVVAAINFCIDKVNWLIRAFNNTLGRVPGVPNVGELDKIGATSNRITAADLRNLRNSPTPRARENEAKSQRDAQRSRAGHSTHVYLDSREVSSKVLKRTRDRARRR